LVRVPAKNLHDTIVRCFLVEDAILDILSDLLVVFIFALGHGLHGE